MFAGAGTGPTPGQRGSKVCAALGPYMGCRMVICDPTDYGDWLSGRSPTQGGRRLVTHSEVTLRVGEPEVGPDVQTGKSSECPG